MTMRSALDTRTAARLFAGLGYGVPVAVDMTSVCLRAFQVNSWCCCTQRSHWISHHLLRSISNVTISCGQVERVYASVCH